MHCEWKTKEILNWTAQQFSNMQSMQWYITSTMWNPHIVKLGLPPNSGEVVFLQIYISCLLLPLSVCLATCWSIASRKFPSHDDVKRCRCGCRWWCPKAKSQNNDSNLESLARPLFQKCHMQGKKLLCQVCSFLEQLENPGCLHSNCLFCAEGILCKKVVCMSSARLWCLYRTLSFNNAIQPPTHTHTNKISPIFPSCETQPLASICWVALSSLIVRSFVVPHR